MKVLQPVDAGPPLWVSTKEKPDGFKFLLFVSLLLYNSFGLFSVFFFLCNTFKINIYYVLSDKSDL